MIVPMILQYGLPFTEKLIDKWTNHANEVPTAQEWSDLKAMAAENAKTQMLAALARAGIDPNSPQGLAFMDKVPA